MKQKRTTLERITERMQNKKTVCVSALTGRNRWWVQVLEIHPSGHFIKVQGMKAFGRPRWIGVESVRFT